MDWLLTLVLAGGARQAMRVAAGPRWGAGCGAGGGYGGAGSGCGCCCCPAAAGLAAAARRAVLLLASCRVAQHALSPPLAHRWQRWRTGSQTGTHLPKETKPTEKNRNELRRAGRCSHDIVVAKMTSEQTACVSRRTSLSLPVGQACRQAHEGAARLLRVQESGCGLP